MKSILTLIIFGLLLGFAACGQKQQQAAPQGQGTLPGGTTEQAPAAAPGTTSQAGY